MGKQKLNVKYVQLVKHLVNNKRWNHRATSDFIRICGQKNVWKIINGIRWGEVETPNVIKGEKLYYSFLEEGEL